jgi:hypothetical protein
MTEIQNNFHFHQSPTYNNYFESVKDTYLNTPNGRMIENSRNHNKNITGDRMTKTMTHGMLSNF